MLPLRSLAQLEVRAHAAAFGFSEPESVIAALRLMKADAFFLLENPEDRAYKHHLGRGVNVHDLLDRQGIAWESVTVDLWNPAAIGGELRRLVREHELRELLVNASVGPNTVAVGATLASLFAPIHLFHPGGARPEEPLRSLDDLRWLPTLRMPGWSGKHIAVLDALHACGGSAKGADVKEWLRKHVPEVIGKGSGRGNWAQREHARFQQLLEQLRDAGALGYVVSHRRLKLRLEPEGEQLRLLLAGLPVGG